jgi:hypothetical protein
MRIIHCTQKLLKELKVTDPVAVPDNLPAKGLGNWYANLLRFNRRKCILFTNEKSIYSFLIPNVKKENLMHLHEEFMKHLTRNLQFEEFPLEVINSLNEEYLEIAYAKTNSRRVLGFMNDFAFHYEFIIERAGGLQNMNLMEENAQINRTPCNASKRDHFRPIDVIREMI